jgi:DNA-binding NarL/FixJ family response regulator
MRDASLEDPSESTEAAARAVIKILIIGARLFAEALAVSLGTDEELRVIGIHTDPALALDHLGQARPDVVVLDDAMAQLDAAQLIGVLRGVQSDLRAIVVATTCDQEALSAYVRAGAAGCVTVDRAFGEFVESVKQVNSGALLFGADQLLDLLTKPRSAGAAQSLAPREREVLQVLAMGRSTEEAAVQLGISVHTLRTHLKKAMTKLSARSKLEAIIQALRAGIIELPR